MFLFLDGDAMLCQLLFPGSELGGFDRESKMLLARGVVVGGGAALEQ